MKKSILTLFLVLLVASFGWFDHTHATGIYNFQPAPQTIGPPLYSPPTNNPGVSIFNDSDPVVAPTGSPAATLTVTASQYQNNYLSSGSLLCDSVASGLTLSPSYSCVLTYQMQYAGNGGGGNGGPEGGGTFQLDQVIAAIFATPSSVPNMAQLLISNPGGTLLGNIWSPTLDPQPNTNDCVPGYDWNQGVNGEYFTECGEEVIPPSSSPTASLTASPTSVVSGSSSTLTYKCTNSTSGSISGLGPITADGSSHTIPTGAISASTTYTLTCTGPGGPATATATVSVAQPPAAILSASPSSVNSGNLSTLTYECDNSTSGIIDQSIGTITADGASHQVATPALTANTTYTLTCTGPGGQATNQATVTVTVPLPDLTAGAVTLKGGGTTVTQNVPVNFEATISNIGDSATGAGFSDLFEHTDAIDANGVATGAVGDFTPATSQNALNANSNAVVDSVSYKYTSSDLGTEKYIRACADKRGVSDTNGTINEGANENNNCGPWTLMTMNSGTPGVSCTDDASNPVSSGANVKFTATPSGGATTPYTWLLNGVVMPGKTAPNILYATTTGGTYYMTVQASGATGTYTCSPNVEVANGPNMCSGVTTGTLTATPTRVEVGGTSVLSWSNIDNVPDNATCLITGSDNSSYGVGTANSCSIPQGSTPTTKIYTQTKYCLACGGAPLSCAVVNVVPKFQEF